MTTDMVQTIGKYLIAIAALVGCFIIIYQAKDPTETAWAIVGLIVGWIVRDSAGQQATTNAVKTIAAANGTNPA